jgi:hypothetical protein
LQGLRSAAAMSGPSTPAVSVHHTMYSLQLYWKPATTGVFVVCRDLQAEVEQLKAQLASSKQRADTADAQASHWQGQLRSSEDELVRLLLLCSYLCCSCCCHSG